MSSGQHPLSAGRDVSRRDCDEMAARIRGRQGVAGGEAMSGPGDTSNTEALGEDEDEADFGVSQLAGQPLAFGASARRSANTKLSVLVSDVYEDDEDLESDDPFALPPRDALGASVAEEDDIDVSGDDDAFG